MHASLPMYDFPHMRAATDRFWQAIRAALGDGPEALTRDGDVWAAWEHPDLFFSQTCGLPYRGRLHGRVALIGTPDYGLPGCGPGEYNSVFVVRMDDPRGTLEAFEGAPYAVNSATSQSGWAGPIVYARSKNVRFGENVKTGAHIRSAEAVATGQADIAGLDALSWRFMQREPGFDARLRVIDQTTPTPGLPYITALGRDPARLFTALETAIAEIGAADRAALSLHGLVRIDAAQYLAVPTPAPP
ncbi:MAG: PhnD/SsuA/transferrin family substrate-binding protein, partial [Pseudomonadota bacterium]